MQRVQRRLYGCFRPVLSSSSSSSTFVQVFQALRVTFRARMNGSRVCAFSHRRAASSACLPDRILSWVCDRILIVGSNIFFIDSVIEGNGGGRGIRMDPSLNLCVRHALCIKKNKDVHLKGASYILVHLRYQIRFLLSHLLEAILGVLFEILHLRHS